MGIISEFRTLQKDVAVLRDRSGDDIATTGTGFQPQGTAGFLTASSGGLTRLGCTVYSYNNSIQNAFYAGSMRLTEDSDGAIEIAVKQGRNKLSLANASIVEPTNSYQGSQYLSKLLTWLPDKENAVYAAIARSGQYAIIMPLGGGGGGDFDKGEITYVSNVSVMQPDQYTLQIDVTKLTAQVCVWH